MSLRSLSRGDRAPTVASDADILEAIAQGDLGALGALFDRYHADVWRVLGRYLPDEKGDVDDLVQQTFLEIPKIAASFDGRASCRSWLYGVAVRLALRRRRGLGRFRQMLSAFTAASAERTAIDPESETTGRQELRILERAVAALNEGKRAAFVLVELEGLSMVEAAEVLRLPAATVRTRLFHARRELRAAMARDGAL